MAKAKKKEEKKNQKKAGAKKASAKGFKAPKASSIATKKAARVTKKTRTQKAYGRGDQSTTRRP
tara:strand:+ start:163 stop:354 length:192 start_codon:yes stop_codon:yes gene_type:complete